MYKEITKFIHKLYNTEEFIPLHAPVFNGNEKKYLNECIDSTFVSSVGKFVDQFENFITFRPLIYKRKGYHQYKHHH